VAASEAGKIILVKGLSRVTKREPTRKQLRCVTLAWSLVLVCSCGAVKEHRVVTVPPAYLAAQTVRPVELVSLFQHRYADVKALAVSRLEVEFTGGSLEEGYFEKYRKAGGYLAVRNPDSIFLNVLNPLTKSSVLVLAADSGRFQVWIPSRNQFVTGPTDMPAREENAIHNVRPEHILPALLIEPIPIDPLHRLSVEEQQDPRFKYYAVSVLREEEEDSRFLQLERRIWIERSGLELVRQQYFEAGALVSEIRYRSVTSIETKMVPTEIEVARPQEGYTVRLVFDGEGIRLDPELRTDVFALDPPPGAEVIEVGETGDSSPGADL